MSYKPVLLFWLVVRGVWACETCLAAHRHALAQSFGFDFGIWYIVLGFIQSDLFTGISYNYNIVAQGSPFTIVSQGNGAIVIDQNTGKCHVSKQGAISSEGHHDNLAFNIGSGMQWSSAGRICSWPKVGGPIIVKVGFLNSNMKFNSQFSLSMKHRRRISLPVGICLVQAWV